MPTRNPERVLIHAPYGRDGAMIAQVLSRAGIESEVCPDIHTVCRELAISAGAIILADEALREVNVQELGKSLGSQERWSDLPVIVLTGEGESTARSRHRLRLLKPLGNLTLLERPLRSETAISAVETALRARRRQYEVRDLVQSLQQTNAELKVANQELEEFAYVASHDLQEPLRMVNIYTQLIERKLAGNFDEEARTCAALVHGGVTRMARLLHDLLAFSRVIHADGPSERSASLARALTDSIAVLQPRIDECQAIIIRGDLPETFGDEAQFSQVFENLISNALKYCSEGQRPRITISSRRHGDNWVISVQDDGIGIDPRHFQRIFGLFKRLHRSEYPGTGIGLAICKRIVERHRGRIWVESQPGRGSTFSFTAPVRDERTLAPAGLFDAAGLSLAGGDDGNIPTFADHS